MSKTPSFLEDHISQIPALQMLINMGYSYLTPDEALKARNHNKANVILENILRDQLKKNKINYKGTEYDFSDSNIESSIKKLKDVVFDGLVRTNEKIYDLISVPVGMKQNIEGDNKSHSLYYIDWDNIENNVYHVTEEFEVETENGKSTRRPDIVIFVNGIPFVVIECKRPDIKEPINEAISQHIRNQKTRDYNTLGDGIPKLFTFTQILIATSKNEIKYATTGTPKEFWSVWKENRIVDDSINDFINTPLTKQNKDKLFSNRYNYVRKYFDDYEKQPRLITEQDRGLYSLCQIDRMVELIYKFIIFDGGVKKVARYQQYYAVKKTLERVKKYNDNGSRQGGVIWHTQGSGKSLTMVMIVKSLELDRDISNPRVILVTDRISLDKQLKETFKNTGKEVEQAKSGEDLLKLLTENKASIITTVVDKFRSSFSDKNIKKYSVDSINSKDIFVLVDESHRSQYGSTNTLMNRVLPDACYVGFTGTPLLKKDKNTADKFGGYIDKYTIDQAVKDKAVVPLYYEGRHVIQDVNKKSIDTWFERTCKSLSDEQIKDLKKKFSRIDKLNTTEQKIYMIAYDISEHYSNNWQGTPFKGQLATASKMAAIKFKKIFDEIGLVTTEVVVSSPDTREGHKDVDEETEDMVQKFWNKTMDKYGNEKSYNDTVTNNFKDKDHPEIIIVVDKLLVGFDAPKNRILYIAKPLKDHTLLQAIARVNRLYEGKDEGYIIDYQGILGDLDTALTSYSALEEFDEEDIADTLVNVKEAVDSLPDKHTNLINVFKTIQNKMDEEEYEQFLYDEEIRQDFYQKLTEYSKALGIALSTKDFYDDNSDRQIKKYKDGLRFYQKLRVAVKKRYAESVDYKEYEAKIQKLLDQYVSSDEILKVVEPVNIFNERQFKEEIEKIESKASKADTIAHRTKKSIEEKMDEDPVFYTKFSKLLEEAIEDYKNKRINEAEYLANVTEIMNSVVNRKDDGTPEILTNRDIAKAFYGVVNEVLSDIMPSDNGDIKELSAEIGLDIDDIIKKLKVIDWQSKNNIQNTMKNKIEDYLEERSDLNLDYDQIDKILEKVLDIAKKRYV